MIDFFRMAPGKHVVERIEHDPNRSAHIALIMSELTQKKSYIVAAEGMRAGDVIQSYRSGIPPELIKSMGGVMDPGMLAAKTAHRGNCLPIRMVPLGTQVFNVGSTVGKGAVFCRSAGTYAIVISKEENRKRSKRWWSSYRVVKCEEWIRMHVRPLVSRAILTSISDSWERLVESDGLVSGRL